MRILHLCLACFYIDGYNYQENVLPRISKENGHDVMIIASTETYVDNSVLGYIEPSEYVTEFGVPIKRLPYKKIATDRVSQKIRKYIGLYEEIEKFRPDIIFSHDLSFGSVADVCRYIQKHKDVTFLADTHTAEYNSGQNWVSLNILHRLIYKHYIKMALPYLKKYYYIGPAERDFSLKNYDVPANMMEFLPLGGVIPDAEDASENRRRIRKELNMEDELLLVHSGKLSPEKRTAELMRAFIKADKLKAKLVIIGSIPEETKKELTELADSDNRICYLGWKQSSQLMEYLSAADMYCQPGTASATLQNAICCGAAIMTRPMEIYTMLDKGNFFWVDSEDDMYALFDSLIDDPDKVESAKANSEKCAGELLDYRKMEERIIAEHHQ